MSCWRVRLLPRCALRPPSSRDPSFQVRLVPRRTLSTTAASHLKTQRQSPLPNFVPATQLDNIEPLTIYANQAPPKPDTSTFFTGRTRFYETVYGLEEQRKLTSSLLREVHLVPFPDKARRNLPRWSPVWQSAAEMEAVVGTALTASMHRKLLRLLKEIHELRRIALAGKAIDVFVQLDGVVNMYERPPKVAERKAFKDTRDENMRSYALGRRKESSARVWLIPTFRRVGEQAETGTGAGAVGAAAEEVPRTTGIAVEESPRITGDVSLGTAEQEPPRRADNIAEEEQIPRANEFAGGEELGRQRIDDLEELFTRKNDSIAVHEVLEDADVWSEKDSATATAGPEDPWPEPEPEPAPSPEPALSSKPALPPAPAEPVRTTEILVNNRPLYEYFRNTVDRTRVVRPLKVAQVLGQFNVFALVRGGGLSGQAGAIAHGIARNLIMHQPALEPLLLKSKILLRDPRMVERKKTGQPKARKKYTWIKR